MNIPGVGEIGIISDELGLVGDPFAAIGRQEMFDQQNKGVSALFFMKADPHPARSEAEGRPIFVETEHVAIFVAGDALTVHCEPVNDKIRERFAVPYKLWKEKGIAQMSSGTPLRQWPIMTPVKVMELEALKIYSVEDLANVSDNNLNRMPDLRELRARAQAYMDQARGGAEAAKNALENERLKVQLAEVKEQYDLMARIVERLQAKELEREKAA
jgi:hypothetical protein